MKNISTPQSHIKLFSQVKLWEKFVLDPFNPDAPVYIKTGIAHARKTQDWTFQYVPFHPHVLVTSKG